MKQSQILIRSILSTFKISEELYSLNLLEDSVNQIKPEHYEEYFKSLFRAEFEYVTGLDRVLSATRSYCRKYEQLHQVAAIKLSKKINNFALMLYSNSSVKELSMSEKLREVDSEDVFDHSELEVINLSGGLEKFIKETKVSVDIDLIKNSYSVLFYDKELVQQIDFVN